MMCANQQIPGANPGFFISSLCTLLCGRLLPSLNSFILPFLYRSYYTLITSFGIRSVVVGDTRGTSREKEAVSA